MSSQKIVRYGVFKLNTSKRIDCFRKRYMGHLRLTAQCPPEPEVCGLCPTHISCEESLEQHRRALNAFVIQGKDIQEVQEGDRRKRYFRSVEHIRCLKEEIRKLEMECGGPKSHYAQSCDNGCLSSYGVFERTRPPPIRICTRRWSG